MVKAFLIRTGVLENRITVRTKTTNLKIMQVFGQAEPGMTIPGILSIRSFANSTKLLQLNMMQTVVKIVRQIR